MKKYVIVFIAAIILVPLALYLYVRSGYAPAFISVPFEHFFAGLEMDIIPSNRPPKKYAGPPTEAELLAGAHLYHEQCALCHGLPNEPRTVIAKGLDPRPPRFFRPEESAAYNPSLPFRPATPKVYWKVKNGVSHTGMPSFRGAFTEKQIWELSQFLGNARNLPPNAIAVLEGKSQKAQPPSASESKGHPQVASNPK